MRPHERADRDSFTPRNPVKAYAAHAQDVQELLRRLDDGLIDCTTATWPQVGSVAEARELLVRAAHALGAITTEEARESYSVRL